MKRWRNYNVFFLGLCFFIATSCDTDNNLQSPDKDFFMKLYGGDGNQSGVDMIVLNDGTFLLLGNSESGGIRKTYLVKADGEGEILWEKKYGNTTDVAKDIEPANDGNFVILSTFLNPLSDSTDIKLIRIQPDGTVIDSVMYGSPKNDDAKSVTPLMDGGFIITGTTQWDTAKLSTVDPDAFSNIFHYKCNSNLVFDEDWYELYGATNKIDAGTKVIQVASDTFYVFGSSNQDHVGNQIGKMNLQYYSISEEGIISNQVGYLGDFDQDTRSSYVTTVPPELGGGFLIIGTKTSNTGAVTLHVSKLRSPLRFNPVDDEQLDEEISIGTKTLEAVSATASLGSPNGYLLLANEVRTLGTNIWLTKIDQSAREQWSVSLGSDRENDYAAAVKELQNGKIIVLGTVGLGDNQTKMALFKLNSSGRLQE